MSSLQSTTTTQLLLSNSTISPTPPLEFNWIVVYSFVCPILLLITLLVLFDFFRSARKRRSVPLSRQLHTHLFLWFVGVSTKFVIFVLVLYAWAQPETQLFGDFVFFQSFRGAGHNAATNTLPASTTFVLIDRIQVIKFATAQSLRHKTQLLSVFVLCFLFAFNFCVFFWRAYNDVRYRSHCTFVCSFTAYVDDLLALKMSFSFLNLILGFVFMYVYICFARKFATVRNEKKLNYTVLLLFISELFFVIIPAGLYLHFQSATIPIINVNSGSAVSIGFCIDGLLVSLVYWQAVNCATNKIASSQRGVQNS